MTAELFLSFLFQCAYVSFECLYSRAYWWNDQTFKTRQRKVTDSSVNPSAKQHLLISPISSFTWEWQEFSGPYKLKNVFLVGALPDHYIVHCSNQVAIYLSVGSFMII